MGTLAAVLGIFSGLAAGTAAYYTYRAKVAKTPQDDEVQKARAERDAQIKQNKDWVTRNK